MFDGAKHFTDLRSKIVEVFDTLVTNPSFYTNPKRHGALTKLSEEVLLLVDSYGSRNGYLEDALKTKKNK